MGLQVDMEAFFKILATQPNLPDGSRQLPQRRFAAHVQDAAASHSNGHVNGNGDAQGWVAERLQLLLHLLCILEICKECPSLKGAILCCGRATVLAESRGPGEASTSGQDQGVAVELDNVVFGFASNADLLKFRAKLLP